MHASEQTTGRLSQNALPGLKSVARAIAAPASTMRLACGIGRSRKSALAGSKTPTTSLRREGADACLACRLEVVDRPRADLDRERNRAELRELVPVQAQCKPCLSARLEIAARLPDVERAALDEDVCGFGDLRRRRQDLGEQKVEVRVGVVELRRHRVRAQEGRDPSFLPDHLQRGDLGLAIEPVARLGLEGRGAGGEHPASMPAQRLAQPLAPGLPSCAYGREDAAPGSVELLVARPGGTQRELIDAIAAKARVRVTVDQPGDRTQAARVQHVDIAAELRELSHLPDSRDQPVLAEHERVLQNVDLPEGAPTKWRVCA